MGHLEVCLRGNQTSRSSPRCTMQPGNHPSPAWAGKSYQRFLDPRTPATRQVGVRPQSDYLGRSRSDYARQVITAPTPSSRGGATSPFR